MGNTYRYQRVRTRMFNLNPYCPECGVLMILPKTLPRSPTGKVKFFPPNICTYEHIHSRINPDRKLHIPNKNRILCLKCNNKKGREDELTLLTKEEIKQRSLNGKTKNKINLE